jgi:Fur family ferric uptake transcriptional regulator
MASTLGREEKEVLAAHLARHGLKRSAQREVILEAFLRTGRHVSVEELLRIVRRRRADIGRTTIYRSLKLFKDAGLASELTYGGEARFETLWKRDNHDHFICGGCGEIFEFKSPEIEHIQETIAHSIGFRIEGHRHHILGLCRKCVAKASSSSRSSSSRA